MPNSTPFILVNGVKRYLNLSTENCGNVPTMVNPPVKEKSLPKSFDLRDLSTPGGFSTKAIKTMRLPVPDEGSSGASAAHVLAAVFRANSSMLKAFVPSPSFIFYNERAKLGNQTVTAKNTDKIEFLAGSLENAISAAQFAGITSESVWSDPSFSHKPSEKAYEDAKNHEVAYYYEVPLNPVIIKRAIASNYAVTVGISIFSSFAHVGKDGVVPLPNATDKAIGAKAFAIVGYNDIKNHWIVMNTWGPEFGDAGYCYIPYSYLTKDTVVTDLWVITVITNH